MDKLKKEWVEDWSVKSIIAQAVSLGIEFGIKGGDPDTLKKNKKILNWAINKKIKNGKDQT